jgi:crotonobetainyl-CoA:carnitine CoA-transferase CaiB-like acyl-CoA transferase
LIDVSCVEALALRVEDQLVRWQLGGSHQRGPSADGLAVVVLSRDFRWVATELGSEADASRLASVIDMVAVDDADVVAEFERWVAAHDRADVVTVLRAAGLPVSASVSNVDLLGDPELWARRVLRPVDPASDDAPTALVGFPWHSPGNRWPALETCAGPLSAGPELGADTDAVRRELIAGSTSRWT